MVSIGIRCFILAVRPNSDSLSLSRESGEAEIEEEYTRGKINESQFVFKR